MNRLIILAFAVSSMWFQCTNSCCSFFCYPLLILVNQYMWGKSSASGRIKGEIRKWRRKGTEAFDFFNFFKVAFSLLNIMEGSQSDPVLTKSPLFGCAEFKLIKLFLIFMYWVVARSAYHASFRNTFFTKDIYVLRDSHINTHWKRNANIYHAQISRYILKILNYVNTRA